MAAESATEERIRIIEPPDKRDCRARVCSKGSGPRPVLDSPRGPRATDFVFTCSHFRRGGSVRALREQFQVLFYSPGTLEWMGRGLRTRTTSRSRVLQPATFRSS